MERPLCVCVCVCVQERLARGNDPPGGPRAAGVGSRYSSVSHEPAEWTNDPDRPCSGERMLLMFDRWQKLSKSFYSEKKDTFDISKVCVSTHTHTTHTHTHMHTDKGVHTGAHTHTCLCGLRLCVCVCVSVCVVCVCVCVCVCLHRSQISTTQPSMTPSTTHTLT